MDMNRNVYEGWTPQDFIDRIQPGFDRRLNGRGFKDKAEMVEYVCGEQPYYKKRIPEVVSYFWAQLRPVLEYEKKVYGEYYGS